MPASFSSLWARISPRPPRPPEQSNSKAGRNLKAAVPTALVLLAIVALAVLVKIEFFVVVIALALCIGMWEVAGAFMTRDIHISIFPLWIATIAMVSATWFGGLAVGLTVFLLSCGAIFILRVRDGEKRSGWDAVASIFALGWISMLGCFAVELASLPDAPWLVALLILMPVANDTGGWAFGVLWGKHPMSPRISPKKSWEGFAGSLVVAFVVAFVLIVVALGKPWYLAILVGAVAVACATLGDLSESMLKRELGVKDMGTIFPGHGGMLDRIDSILMWAPFCWLIMYPTIVS